MRLVGTPFAVSWGSARGLLEARGAENDSESSIWIV
jgi:hypothetical protein